MARRLYRTGESEYLLNKSVCRLRDIQDLFAGTGVNPKAYALMDQDRLNHVLTAKPWERRIFIEEAAGVARYKQQRAETQGKLDATRQNLQRVRDVMDEVKRPGRARSSARRRRRSSTRRSTRSGRPSTWPCWRPTTPGSRPRTRRCARRARGSATGGRRARVAIAEIEAREATLRAAIQESEYRLADLRQSAQKFQGEVERLLERREQMGAQIREMGEEELRLGEEIRGTTERRAEVGSSGGTRYERPGRGAGALRRAGPAGPGARGRSGASPRPSLAGAARPSRRCASSRSGRPRSRAELTRSRGRAAGARRPARAPRASGSTPKRVRADARPTRWRRRARRLETSFEQTGVQLSLLTGESEQVEQELVRQGGLRVQAQESLAALRVGIAAKESAREALGRLEREREGYGAGVRSLFSPQAAASVAGVVGTVADLLEVPPGSSRRWRRCSATASSG